MNPELLTWKTTGIGSRHGSDGAVMWEAAKVSPLEIPRFMFSMTTMDLIEHGFEPNPELTILIERITFFNNYSHDGPPAGLFHQVPLQQKDFLFKDNLRLYGRIGQWVANDIRDFSEARRYAIGETLEQAIALCPFVPLYIWPGLDGVIPSGMEATTPKLREMAVAVFAPLRGILPEDVLIKIPYGLIGASGRAKICFKRFTQAQLKTAT